MDYEEFLHIFMQMDVEVCGGVTPLLRLSSVRMRTASSPQTKTLPSPILPVFAACPTIAATAWVTSLSRDDQFEFDLGQEVHRVFAAAVDFRGPSAGRIP